MNSPGISANNESPTTPPIEKTADETLRGKFAELNAQVSSRHYENESVEQQYFLARMRNARLTVSNEFHSEDLKKATFDIENLRTSIVAKNVAETGEQLKIKALRTVLDKWRKKFPSDALCGPRFFQADPEVPAHTPDASESPWLQKARDDLDASLHGFEREIQKHDRSIAMAKRTAELVDVAALYDRRVPEQRERGAAAATRTPQPAHDGGLLALWGESASDLSEEDLHLRTRQVCEGFEQLQQWGRLTAQSSFNLQLDTARVGCENKFLISDLEKAAADLEKLKTDLEEVTKREEVARHTVQELKRWLADWKSKFPNDELCEERHDPIDVFQELTRPPARLPEFPWRRSAVFQIERELSDLENRKRDLRWRIAAAKEARARVDVDAEYAHVVAEPSYALSRHACSAPVVGNNPAMEEPGEESDEEVVAPERMLNDIDPSDEAALFGARDLFMDD